MRSKKEKPQNFYTIITEDEKSSFSYIEGLLRYLNQEFQSKTERSRKYKKHHSYRLELEKTVLIFDIIHHGSCPSSIKTVAKDFRTKCQKIFCVFDKDSHDNKGKNGQLNHGQDLRAYCNTHSQAMFCAYSVPSFEYWLYLHFKYLASPVLPQEEDSASDRMQKIFIQNCFPDYKKGKLNFDDFKNDIHVAINNAEKSIERYDNTGDDNPVTYMGRFYSEIKEIITA